MQILIFLHGTIIMHANAKGCSREEIIKQVQEQESSVRDFFNYLPIGNAPKKLKKWTDQGAEISYLSALTANKKGRGDEIVGQERLLADSIVLDKYSFPQGNIYHREQNEEYKNVVNKIAPPPDILIEDDCESMGDDAEQEITYNQLDPELQRKIKSILVKEFSGIDYLPNNIDSLKDYYNN